MAEYHFPLTDGDDIESFSHPEASYVLNNVRFTVGGDCYQSWPCKHDVLIEDLKERTGKIERWSVIDIIDRMETDGQELTDHLSRFKKGSEARTRYECKCKQ